jgi:hypothetical protein
MGQPVVATQPHTKAALEVPVELLNQAIFLWAVSSCYLMFDAQQVADLRHTD